MDEKFDALQVLRALAAGLVVFAHAMVIWSVKGAPAGSIPDFPQLGDFGVKLFFCISGFIIVHTSARLPQGAHSAKAFWRRRIVRIVPLYWIMTTVYLLKLVLDGRQFSPGEVLRSYAFIPYVNAQGLVQPILGQGWSLNYEMFFYLVFGALLLLPRRHHALALTVSLTALAGMRLLGWLGDDKDPSALYHWADAIVLYLLAGVIASLLATRWRQRAAPALSQNGAALLASLVVVAYGAFVLPAAPVLAALWMPVPCIVALMLCVTARPGPCSGLWQPVVQAGDASYSTYLTHGFVMGLLARLIHGMQLPFGYYSFAWTGMLVCTLAGILIYTLLERPLTRRLKRDLDSFVPARTLARSGVR